MIEPDDALADIAGRYLAAFGPATPAELGAWWGANRTYAERMIAALGQAVTLVNVEGDRRWMLADQVAELAATSPAEHVVRLLPGFDQWVVCASRPQGSGHRLRHGTPLLDAAHRSLIYRQQGWVSPVVLVNGRMSGVWKHQKRGRRVDVEVEPFGRLPEWTRRPLETEAERLAVALSGGLKLTVTS